MTCCEPGPAKFFSPSSRSSLPSPLTPRDGSALATRPRQTSGAPARLRVPFPGGRLPDRPVPVADHAVEGRFPSAPPHTVRPARRADREHRAPASHPARAQSGRSARNSARASNSPALRRHACTLHHRRFQFAIVLAVGLLLTFVFYYRHTSAQRREAELEAQKRSRRLAAKAAAAANGGGGGAAAAAGAAANGAAANGAAKPSTPAAAKSPTKSKKAKKSD